jgi:DNA-binding transcriptional LysR family regulator
MTVTVMDRITAMATFVKVVDAGSFTAVARNLNIGLTSVARQVGMLEERLGVRLLVRSTRRLALTEEGRTYYDHARRILNEVEDAELVLAKRSAEPTGRLAVCAPVLFGRLVIAPLLPQFLAANPRVTVDLTLADRAVNLVEEGFDVLVLAGPLEDSSLIAHKIGNARRVVCGSPAYLERHGVPRIPADLKAHDCIVFTMLDDDRRWLFRTGQGEQSVPVTGRLRSNNADTVLAAALGGAGLILAPWMQVHNNVVSGELKIVLEEFELPPAPLHALFPHAKLLSPKVRAFTDMLSEHFPRIEWLRLAA